MDTEGRPLHSRLSKSTDDLEESTSFEKSRTSDGADGKTETSRLSRQTKKKSQSMESLDDILDDDCAEVEGQSATGDSTSSTGTPLPHKVETREVQSAENMDENILVKSSKVPGCGEPGDLRSAEDISGTMHYTKADREVSDVATEDVHSVCKDRQESVSSALVDYELDEGVSEHAGTGGATCRVKTQSESLSAEHKDVQDSLQQQQSTTDDWLQQAKCHEETAVSSSKHHEKADLSKKVGRDGRHKPVASMELDASEDSEHYAKHKSELLQKDGQKLEMTSTQEADRDESYEKIAMAAKTDRGEVVEESGTHHLSTAQKQVDETTEETCTGGVLKSSSSREMSEAEDVEQTECDRQTKVEKDDSGHTRQSSSMKSSSHQESRKRAVHQGSSQSSQSSGPPGKTPKFEPKLGAFGKERERVFDSHLGKYVPRLRAKDAMLKTLKEEREGDRLDMDYQEANTDTDYRGVCRDKRHVCPPPLSTDSGINTSGGAVSADFDQDSALSEVSTDLEHDSSMSEALAPIGTIDELDDYDDDFGSDSGFDTLSTVSQMEVTAALREASGLRADMDSPGLAYGSTNIAQNAGDPNTNSRGHQAGESVPKYLQPPVGVPHPIMRYDDARDGDDDVSDIGLAAAPQGGECSSPGKQDTPADKRLDKPGVKSSMGLPDQATAHADEISLLEGCSGSSNMGHVQQPQLQPAGASISELCAAASTSRQLSGSGPHGPAKFVSTSQAVASSADGRGASSEDGISMPESDEAEECTGQIHTSDPSQPVVVPVRGQRGQQARASTALFSGDDSAQTQRLSESFERERGQGGECVQPGSRLGETWGENVDIDPENSGRKPSKRPELTGSIWQPCREATSVSAAQHSKSKVGPNIAQSTDNKNANKTKTEPPPRATSAAALSSADIFAREMDEIKPEKEAEDSVQLDAGETDRVPHSMSTSHAEGTSQSCEVTDTVEAGMLEHPGAVDTMSPASQHLEHEQGAETAGDATEHVETQQPVPGAGAMEANDSSSSSSPSSDDEAPDSGEDLELDQSFELDFEDSFEEVDGRDIMQEMKTMEQVAAAAAEEGDPGENEMDISEQAAGISKCADITEQGISPALPVLTSSTESGADADISQKQATKKNADVVVVDSSEERSAAAEFSSQEGVSVDNPEVPDKGFDSELDLSALEKDAELLSDRENVAAYAAREYLTSENEDETLDEDEMLEDKYSHDNVVRAMKTLTQRCDEPSVKKPRPHSFHGDQSTQTASAWRRYDWNTLHFFPDIHDTDECSGWVKRYSSRRGRPQSQYVEEEWIRDLYYYDQQEMQHILNRSGRSKLGQGQGQSQGPPPPPPHGHPDQMDMVHESMMNTESARQLAEVEVNRTGTGDRPRKTFRERRSNSDLKLNQIYYMDSESSTDSGDASPRKSSLNVRRARRRDRKDRPHSAEIHYTPPGSASRQSPKIYMGSPMLKRKEEAAKHKRVPRRTSNPTENGSPRRNGTGRNNSDLVQEKLQKFQELQQMRKALESSSEECLPSAAARADVQRENVKEKRFGAPLPHELHMSRQRDGAFQDYEQDMEISQREAELRNLHYERYIELLQAARDRDPRDPRDRNPRHPRDPRRSRNSDPQLQQQQRAAVNGALPRDVYRQGDPLKSQFDFRSLEDDHRHVIPHGDFHGDNYDRRKQPYMNRELSSSFENIYDGVDLSMYYSSMDTIDPSEFRNIVEQERRRQNHEPVAEQQRNGYHSYPQQQQPHHPSKVPPGEHELRHRAPPSEHDQYDRQRVTTELPHVLKSKDISHPELSIQKDQAKQVFQEPAGISSASPGTDGNQSPLWYVPKPKQEYEKDPKQPSTEKLDAKALIEEEKRKFVDYKREYHRRLSERGSTDGTSGDEMRRESGDDVPVFSPTTIPPDDYEYVLHKVHHKRQEALYGGTPPTERSKLDHAKAEGPKKLTASESNDKFLAEMKKRKTEQVLRTGAKQTYLTDDFFTQNNLSQSQSKLDITPTESLPLRRSYSDQIKPASPYAKYISPQKPDHPDSDPTAQSEETAASIKDRVQQWNKISEVERQQAKRKLSQEPNSMMGPYSDSKRAEHSPRKELAPPHSKHHHHPPPTRDHQHRYSDFERYEQTRRYEHEQARRYEQEMKAWAEYFRGHDQTHSPRNKWVTDVQQQEYPVTPRKAEPSQHSPRREDYHPQHSPRRSDPGPHPTPEHWPGPRDPRMQQYREPPLGGAPDQAGRHNAYPQYPDPRRPEEYRGSPQRGHYSPQRGHYSDPSHSPRRHDGYGVSPQRGHHSDPSHSPRRPEDYRNSPQRGHNIPQRGHDSPQRGHNSPQRGHDSPQRGHNSPQRGHDSPQRGHTSPQRGHNSPQRGHDSPQRGHTSPPKGHSSPPKGHGSPPKGHGSPQKGHHSPQQGNNSPQQGHYSDPSHSPRRPEGSPHRGQYASPPHLSHSPKRPEEYPQGPSQKGDKGYQQKPIYVPPLYTPRRYDDELGRPIYKPYTGTGNQSPDDAHQTRQHVPQLQKVQQQRPDDLHSPKRDQAGHYSPRSDPQYPRATVGDPRDQRLPTDGPFKPNQHNQQSFRPYQREGTEPLRPAEDQQSFRPYGSQKPPEEDPREQFDRQHQQRSEVHSMNLHLQRPLYGPYPEDQLRQQKMADSWSPPTSGMSSPRSRSDEDRDLKKHRYIAERIPKSEGEARTDPRYAQRSRPEPLYQEWGQRRVEQGQGQGPRSPGSEQFDFVPEHAQPVHSQVQLPRQPSDRVMGDAGTRFVDKKPPMPKQVDLIPKELKQWQYNTSYEASPPHDSSKKRFEKFAPTQDQYDYKDVQYHRTATDQFAPDGKLVDAKGQRLPYKNYEDKVLSYCEDQKQKAAEQYEDHIKQSQWQYRSQVHANTGEYADPNMIRSRKPLITDGQQTAPWTVPWRSPLRRAKSLPREQTAVEMEISKTGHIQPKVDAPNNADPNAPLGTYKFHIHLHKSPTQSPAVQRKVSVRMTRSTEDLRVHARSEGEKEEPPRVDISKIKSQLFGQGADLRGVCLPPYKQELNTVLDRSSQKVSSLRKDVFSSSEGRIPQYGSQGALPSYQYENTDDVRLRDYVSYRDGQTRKHSNIRDALTDLEQTYENLNLNQDGLLNGVENYPVTSGGTPLQYSSTDLDPNVKRLSITNVKKLEEIQARLDNPSLEYAKQWLSTEKVAPQTADEVFSTSGRSQPESVELRSYMKKMQHQQQSSSVSITSERELASLSSLPRKRADDMAYRSRTHHQSAPSINNLKGNVVGSYLQHTPGVTPAASVDSLSYRSMTGCRASSPDPLYDDLVYRNMQRANSKSPGPPDHSILAEPSPTTTDYLVERTTEPARGRMRIRPDRYSDKYHDDLAYRKLRKDVEPIVAELPDAYYKLRYGGRSRPRHRSMSMERLSAGSSGRDSDRLKRSSSVGPCTHERRASLSHGVAKMVEVFETSLEISQSAPDLTDQSIFGTSYNINGDLVTDDPRYKHALKPKKQQTPRTVKQRHEMKTRLKQLKTSADSGYLESESDSHSSSGPETHFCRSPPDGAFDSDDLDRYKSSDSDRHSSGSRAPSDQYRREEVHHKLLATDHMPRTSVIEVQAPKRPLLSPVLLPSRATPTDREVVGTSPTDRVVTPPSSLNVASRQVGPGQAKAEKEKEKERIQATPISIAHARAAFFQPPLKTTQSQPQQRPVTVTHEPKLYSAPKATPVQVVPVQHTPSMEESGPGFTKISMDSPLKEIKLAIGEPGTVRGPSSYAVNLPQSPPADGITTETKESMQEISPQKKRAELRKERIFAGPQKREHELKTLTVVEKPDSLKSKFESQRTQKEHKSFESPGHKVNVTTFERETLLKSSSTTYSTGSPGKLEGSSLLPQLSSLQSGSGHQTRPAPHQYLPQWLMSPTSELSDGEMTDATDITLDNLVWANRPHSADTLEYTDSEYCEKKSDSGNNSSSSSENSQREYTVSEGRTHQLSGKTIRTVETMVMRSGGSQPPHGSRSVTETVETTQAEETGKKGGKVQRAPSFKELVRSFEDQASPFMKGNVRKCSSQEELPPGEQPPPQMTSSGQQRRSLREMSGSDPNLAQDQDQGQGQGHHYQQRHSVDYSSSSQGSNPAWRRY